MAHEIYQDLMECRRWVSPQQFRHRAMTALLLAVDVGSAWALPPRLMKQAPLASMSGEGSSTAANLSHEAR